MAKLNLKDFKIEFPMDYEGNHTNEQLIEWLKFEFGISTFIPMDNPLSEIDLESCKVSVGYATLDGEPIVL
jgi:hypothetical protein